MAEDDGKLKTPVLLSKPELDVLSDILELWVDGKEATLQAMTADKTIDNMETLLSLTSHSEETFTIIGRIYSKVEEARGREQFQRTTD